MSVKKLIRRIYQWFCFKWVYPRAFEKAKRLHPMEENRVLFVEYRSETLSNSFRYFHDFLKEKGGYDIEVFYLHALKLHGPQYVKQVISLYQELAKAHYVFLEDASNVISGVKVRPECVITQLWHACGAFKKFGFSTADLIFGGNRRDKTNYPYYKNLDLVTVSAPEIRWAYVEAMGLEETPDVVEAAGISRTDVFFDEEFLSGARDRLLDAVPQVRDKKVILYAPTFRGMVDFAEGPDELDISAFREALGDEYILLIKHHPFVKNRPEIPADSGEFAFDVSDSMIIDDLLCVADVCISDYSSLIYEYSLFNRPMIFFAYDLDDYCDWRGFYYDYDELTPGPVLKTTGEIISYIEGLKNGFDDTQIRAFREKFMGSCDGHSTERIWDIVQEKAVEKRA
ncbi:MAG: CDP-glycerol glycerophosphotransferase family protein [Eubacterium sp.]|nr:CDP-glycerol glycerophosphotransferase family protein [Eubacterium sp.]